MTVFLKWSSWFFLISALLFGKGFANDPVPQSVGQPQLVTEPLLDLGMELTGKEISSPVEKRPEIKPIVIQKKQSTDPVEKKDIVKKATTKEFDLCILGKNQSPVNFINSELVGTTRLKSFAVNYRDAMLRVINTGDTIQVNYPRGSYIKLGIQNFKLLHYNFRTPSEHKMNGFNYPMEMQLFHQDGSGNNLVIAVIFKEGAENQHLAKIMSNLPTRANKQQINPRVRLNPASFFPKNKTFFKYNGSLTTPPCSEGVYWMVFKHFVEASFQQIQKMEAIMGNNARPVQDRNARTFLKSYADREKHLDMFIY